MCIAWCVAPFRKILAYYFYAHPCIFSLASVTQGDLCLCCLGIDAERLLGAVVTQLRCTAFYFQFVISFMFGAPLLRTGEYSLHE